MQEYINYICDIPEFLNKYLEIDLMKRIKNVSYLCGMDKASKDIYDFKYDISRYDHCLSTALITWRYTKNKKATIAALLHDAAIPCFSHVIDYMSQDYINQETTEAFHPYILSKSKDLLSCLKIDNIDIEDIIDFKNYSIVDNERPQLCADRLDGIILTSLAWTKELDIKDIPNILNNIILTTNEKGQQELAFKNKDIAKYIYYLSNQIDIYCHTKEDNYMMELLAHLTYYAIKHLVITYEDLYIMDEETLYQKLKNSNNLYLTVLLYAFEHIKKEKIKEFKLPNVKKREINPLVKSKRLLDTK